MSAHPPVPAPGVLVYERTSGDILRWNGDAWRPVEPCWCCASRVDCRPDCGRPGDWARYAWTTPTGETRALCLGCCAAWRSLAVLFPDAEPLGIVELEA